MDKLSDRVLRPFTLAGDEAQILKDWMREHPREAAAMREYAIEPVDEKQLAAQMYERAQQAKVELLESEGRPAEFWERSELPQSSAGKARELERDEMRRAAKGGAADELERPRAVASKPFKFGWRARRRRARRSPSWCRWRPGRMSMCSRRSGRRDHHDAGCCKKSKQRELLAIEKELHARL